jgi:hypothetical protein
MPSVPSGVTFFGRPSELPLAEIPPFVVATS